MNIEDLNYNKIGALLLDWYLENSRILPWRSDPTPYHVWISEIMLQQTRVEAVKEYYRRFLDVLPDVQALAECEEDVYLKLWEGLGYYSRVRNLHKAAVQITENYDGNLPSDPAELQKLPGIGEYTAGAIASIAFGRPLAAVDGNVLRVLSRLAADPSDIGDPSTKKRVRVAITRYLEERMENDAGAKPGKAVVVKADAAAGTKPGVGVDAEAKAGVAADADAKPGKAVVVKAGTKLGAGVDAEAKIGVAADAGAKSDADANEDTKPESDAGESLQLFSSEACKQLASAPSNGSLSVSKDALINSASRLMGLEFTLKNQQDQSLPSALWAFNQRFPNMPFSPGAFNQAIMDLGATVCLPNGAPKCQLCPLAGCCKALELGLTDQFPVKAPKKGRRIEERTVLILRMGDAVAIRRRPPNGLLAGLWEFPNVPGHLTMKDAETRVQSLGLEPVRTERLMDAKHVFTHVEWRMIGYSVQLKDTHGAADLRFQENQMSEDRFQKITALQGKTDLPSIIFVSSEELQDCYAIPTAFSAYNHF